MDVIQVGSFAFRNPDGTCQKAFPIYAERTPRLEAARDELCETFGGILALQTRGAGNPTPEKEQAQDE